MTETSENALWSKVVPLASQILFLFAFSASAQMYVAPGGSDGNPGTADKPVATVRQALALIDAGARPAGIVLRAGVYTEAVSVPAVLLVRSLTASVSE